MFDQYFTIEKVVADKSNGIDGPTSHGTACAEIVHDMAPEATLYLVNFGNSVELANAVDYLMGALEYLLDPLVFQWSTV